MPAPVFDCLETGKKQPGTPDYLGASAHLPSLTMLKTGPDAEHSPIASQVIVPERPW